MSRKINARALSVMARLVRNRRQTPGRRNRRRRLNLQLTLPQLRAMRQPIRRTCSLIRINQRYQEGSPRLTTSETMPGIRFSPACRLLIKLLLNFSTLRQLPNNRLDCQVDFWTTVRPQTTPPSLPVRFQKWLPRCPAERALHSVHKLFPRSHSRVLRLNPYPAASRREA